MGWTCTICNSPNRLQIDRGLCRGEGYQKLANQYGESAQAIRRHWENGHINYQLKAAQKQRDILEGLNLQSEIDNLIHRTKAILEKAEQGEKLSTALKGIDSLRSTYQMMTDVAFKIHDARIKELELEKEKSGQKADEEAEEFWEGMRQRLNNGELRLLQLILDRITGESDTEVVENDWTPDDWKPDRFLEDTDVTRNDRKSYVKDSRSKSFKPEEIEPKSIPEPDPDEHLKPECEKKKMKRTRPPKGKDGWSRAIEEFG